MDPHSIVPFSTGGRTAFVLSDLHLAAGLNANSNYDGTENFYADHSFVRFINHLQQSLKGKEGILVINGDFIDFLRVLHYPQSNQEFHCWHELLEQAGIPQPVENLKNSISKKEKRYGLKTNDYKTIWKLHRCMQGHKPLFKKLAQWLYQGNDLVIVKGNHDLEWYWPAVQRYLRTALQRLARQEADMNEKAVHNMPQRLHFIQHALVLDGKVYIEHGHRHERTTAVDGSETLNNNAELNLPFGSFFNRYLINRLEIAYPYIDNVRPAQNILPVLIRERFPLALQVLFRYVPFTLLIIPKRLYWYTFKYLLNILFIIVLPLAITAYALYRTWSRQGSGFDPGNLPGFLLNTLQSLGFLLLSYFFGRIMAMAGLKSPPSLSVHAQEVVAQHPQVEAVIYGHTHNPDQKLLDGNKWYFNTGTWIPVFETSSADVRFDKTYTFIKVNCSEAPPCKESLQRWNDDALRTEPMVINDRA